MLLKSRGKYLSTHATVTCKIRQQTKKNNAKARKFWNCEQLSSSIELEQRLALVFQAAGQTTTTMIQIQHKQERNL